MVEEIPKCPRCRAIVDPNAKKCPSCGRFLFREKEEVADIVERYDLRSKEEVTRRIMVSPQERLSGLAMGVYGILMISSFGFFLAYNVIVAFIILAIGAYSLWAGVALFIGHPKGPIASLFAAIITLINVFPAFISILLYVFAILLGSIALAGIIVPWLFNVLTKKKL